MSMDSLIVQLGLDLDDSARAALKTLPEEHALELLEAVANKATSGQVKSASNYVCATVARGYVSRAGGGGKGGGSRGGAAGAPLSGPAYEAAAAALIATPGMQRAEAAGLQLTDEAVQALLRLPAQHASEILEVVADKKGELRDPSNYVVATIARGYKSRSEGTLSGGGFGGGFGGDSWDGGKGGGKSRSSGLIPQDITRLESAVLELNEQNLFPGQEMNVCTLLTLRCIKEAQAIDILTGIQGKGMGKGKGSGIQNINNYIQAAVAKVVREGGGSGTAPGQAAGGKGSSKNYTGNQSKQKAAELGLSLGERAFSILARMPLRSAFQLMEDAASAQSMGKDPNAYIEANEAGADFGDQASKRRRFTD